MRWFKAAPFVVLFVVIVVIIGYNYGHPSSPDPSKVKTIKVINSQDKSTRLVSPDHFADVLALFQHRSRDPNPKKWVGLNYHLEITMDDGKQMSIWLFNTHAELGAFAIGETWEDRVYFRGATDERINETIKEVIASQAETEH